MNLILLIINFCIFGIILISYSSSKFDFVAISLLGCFISGLITSSVLHIDMFTLAFSKYIEFEAIIVILCMSIITKIAQESNILEYLAI
ncbi:MAG: hypothetical protein ACFE9R_05365, partial [Candidatus Hermodarchaeota archaeon]